MALGCLQQQLEEIDALIAVYPEQGALQLAPAEREELRLARALCDRCAEGGGGGGPDSLAELSGTLQLPGARLGGQPVSLRWQLPQAYPEAAGPRLLVHCATGRQEPAAALA
jgi:hypothetical protein